MSIADNWYQRRLANTGVQLPEPDPDVDGFTYVIESRDDLVAIAPPIGDVFTLPSGSYAFKSSINLNTNESIVFAAGTSARIVGMGYLTPIIFGAPISPNAVITVNAGALVYFDGIGVTNIAGGNNVPAVSSAGTVLAIGCKFTNNSAGAGNSRALSVNGGTYRGYGNVYAANLSYAVQLANACNYYEVSSSLTSASSSGLLSGNGVLITKLSDCEITGAFIPAQFISNSMLLDMANCTITVTGAAQPCLSLGQVPSANITGCRFVGPGSGTGIQFDDASGSVSVQGCRFQSLLHAISRTAGVQGAVVTSGNKIASTVTNGYNWAAANIPTRGLAITGDDNAAATPFNGFTNATARVNIKACIGSAGLLSETAIVP